MMAFDADGWYESLFGPAIPVLVGVALGAVGLVIVVRRATHTPTGRRRYPTLRPM
jgi:hypothetical protein